MIAIRTDAGADIGIGHVIRMGHFARELVERGKEVVLLLGCMHDPVRPYIDDLAVHCLYGGKRPPEARNETSDAEATLAFLADKPVELVVLDSYDLGVGWERTVAKGGCRIAVFDDLGNREHECDFLIDQKYEGPRTPERYASLVPASCRRLLGPQYAILHPDYRSNRRSGGGMTPNILFSFGGGGDLSMMETLLCELLRVWPGDEPVVLTPVIGPLAYNAEGILALAEADERVKPMMAPASLYEAYMRASLFVGALGTSLYELAALKIPALTFSMASNQDNAIEALEDLGHYFHLERSEFEQADQTALLIMTLLEHPERLKRLRDAARIPVDALGAVRIADALLSDGGAGAGREAVPAADDEGILLGGDVRIRPVNDTDINRYLDARNLEKNRQNMTLQQAIPRLEHYRWWFSNRRDSFLVTCRGESKLYIWHQKVVFEGEVFLIGGWFVCDDESGFEVAAAALEWQLQYTAGHEPGIPWIAVIKKTNRYVNLLNRYMGFVEVTAGERAYRAIEHCFSEASPETFNYVKYVPKGSADTIEEKA
jgi:UDP-2,4-diacetamido-2,4,6-trideoxy-beta-L-altropyranose hydrolase